MNSRKYSIICSLTASNGSDTGPTQAGGELGLEANWVMKNQEFGSELGNQKIQTNGRFIKKEILTNESNI